MKGRTSLAFGVRVPIGEESFTRVWIVILRAVGSYTALLSFVSRIVNLREGPDLLPQGSQHISVI